MFQAQMKHSDKTVYFDTLITYPTKNLKFLYIYQNYRIFTNDILSYIFFPRSSKCFNSVRIPSLGKRCKTYEHTCIRRAQNINW